MNFCDPLRTYPVNLGPDRGRALCTGPLPPCSCSEFWVKQLPPPLAVSLHSHLWDRAASTVQMRRPLISIACDNAPTFEAAAWVPSPGKVLTQQPSPWSLTHGILSPWFWWHAFHLPRTTLMVTSLPPPHLNVRLGVRTMSWVFLFVCLFYFLVVKYFFTQERMSTEFWKWTLYMKWTNYD